ncbi:MAG: STAS domain-containing protein [Planctomycetaceae bacterium]
MSAYSQLVVDDRNGARVIRLASSRIVDGPSIDALRDELAEAATAAGSSGLVLDLTGVDLISSAGIALLRDFARAIESRGARGSLCCPGPEVEKVLKMVRIERLMPMHPDVTAAVAAVAR